MQDTFRTLQWRQATWLELFFDLVFVAVIGVVAHTLAHTHHGHLSVEQLFDFFLTFVPVLWVWSTHTLFANRYDTDSHGQRYVTLAIMALVIVMSTFITSTSGNGFTGFVTCYVGMRGLQAYSYAKAPRTTPAGNQLARKLGVVIVVGTAISALSLALPEGWREAALYTGIAVEIILQLRLTPLASTFPVHRKHLAERVGLLTIIVLGETVISIIGSMSSADEITSAGVISAVAGFVLIAQIWWVFFGSLHRLERAKRLTTGNVMVLSHLVFYVGLIFLANLVRHAINQDLDHETFAIMAVTGMTLFYVGKQIPYMVAFPPYRFGLVVNSVVCIGITMVATLMSRTEYSLIVMCVGMAVYVQLNVRWLIPSYDVSDYLLDEPEPGHSSGMLGTQAAQ
ncbi:MAG: low temperature requirement protein A [Actinomycetales bacterium]